MDRETGRRDSSPTERHGLQEDGDLVTIACFLTQVEVGRCLLPRGEVSRGACAGLVCLWYGTELYLFVRTVGERGGEVAAWRQLLVGITAARTS